MNIPTAIAVKRSVVIVSIAVASHAHASLVESLTMLVLNGSNTFLY